MVILVLNSRYLLVSLLSHSQHQILSINLKNIVVFASGSGSNFQSIIDATEQGTLKANVVGLVSDRDEIGAIQKARDHAIPHRVLKPSQYSTEDKYAEALLDALQAFKPDLIVLAGFLKKIPTLVIHAYKQRILNIHPSLLPKYGGKGFYGLRVHKAVIANKERTSGCTVHLVTEVYDDGPILGQKVVDVYLNDTPELLAQRVLEQEHQLYPQIISDYLQTLR